MASEGLDFDDLSPAEGLTLFETIHQSNAGDDRAYVLHRGTHVYALMNLYPYSSGHLLVVPNKAMRSMDVLSQEVHEELWATVKTASLLIKKTFKPHGLNSGLNEGTAGGASVPDHLHVHVVPRWAAVTDFMTAIAEARILPVSLSATWEMLRVTGRISSSSLVTLSFSLHYQRSCRRLFGVVRVGQASVIRGDMEAIRVEPVAPEELELSRHRPHVVSRQTAVGDPTDQRVP